MKTIKALAFLLLLIAVSFVSIAIINIASAKSLEFEFGLYTHHLVSDSESLNESNDFISAGVNGYSAGTFVNSLGNRSYAVGYRHEFNPYIGLSFGGIYGYNQDEFINDMLWLGPWLMYLAPDVQYMATESLGLRVRLFGEVVSLVAVVRL
jgi:hypothetical protein